MTAQEVIDTREKIKTWLVQEGLFKEEILAENLYFQIASEFPAKSGRHLSIIQPKSHEDMIVVFSRTRLADAHQNRCTGPRKCGPTCSVKASRWPAAPWNA